MKCKPKVHTKSHLTFHFHFMVNHSAALILSIPAGLTNLTASGEWLGLSVGTPSWWSYCFCCCCWTGNTKCTRRIPMKCKPITLSLSFSLTMHFHFMVNLATALILSVLAGQTLFVFTARLHRENGGLSSRTSS